MNFLLRAALALFAAICVQAAESKQPTIPVRNLNIADEILNPIPEPDNALAEKVRLKEINPSYVPSLLILYMH